MRTPAPDARRRTVLHRIEAMPLRTERKQALREAALDLLCDPTVRGVGVWGSASRGEPNPRDFDLMVLISGIPMRTRRRLYHGQSVHMQMRTAGHFRRANVERKQTRSDRCPVYADLVILWDETDSFATARARARRCRARGPKPVSKLEVMQLRAEITELYEEAEARQTDDSFALLAAHCLSRCAAVHLRLRGAWVPVPKDLLTAVAAMDEEAGGRYRRAVSLFSEPAACLQVMRELAVEALATVGGMAGEYEVFWR